MAITNQTTLIGNLGREASIHEGKNERLFAAFSIATKDSFKNQKGEWQQNGTIWHSVLTFNPRLVEMMKSVKKGARLRVDGRISYKDVPFKSKEGKTIKLRQASIIAWAIEPKPLLKTASNAADQDIPNTSAPTMK